MRHDNRGFSLVEILVAVAILGVVGKLGADHFSHMQRSQTAKEMVDALRDDAATLGAAMQSDFATTAYDPATKKPLIAMKTGAGAACAAGNSCARLDFTQQLMDAAGNATQKTITYETICEADQAANPVAPDVVAYLTNGSCITCGTGQHPVIRRNVGGTITFFPKTASRRGGAGAACFLQSGAASSINATLRFATADSQAPKVVKPYDSQVVLKLKAAPKVQVFRSK